MRRREFITLVGGAATSPLWLLAAHAQQPMPVIGMLNSGEERAYAARVTAFRQGLAESGYVEGQNLAIEHRYANDQYDRLPGLAAELVRRQVAVLFASGGGVAPQIAKAATATIPIVFTGGFDPVQAGLVSSLNRPGGNVTGVTFLANSLEAKRLGLLHELVPEANAIGVLMNPNNASVETAKRDVADAAAGLGLKLRFAHAANAHDFSSALADFDQADIRALLVTSDSVFSGNVATLVALTAQRNLTVMYFLRDFVAAGGLMSYGTSVVDAYRLAGTYAGRILKGEKPASLPVVQSTKFEFVINLKTAKTLGINFPPKLLSIADEVIE
jgi:putative tryptophan/tyrosine transport system substrate-binding protein